MMRHKSKTGRKYGVPHYVRKGISSVVNGNRQRYELKHNMGF